MSGEPVKLVTSAEQISNGAVDVVESSLAEMREKGRDVHAVLIVYVHGPNAKTHVRYFGKGRDLLACATRAAHEINQAIDDDD